jgi:capsular exopolysaccharide synthesis family protein
MMDNDIKTEQGIPWRKHVDGVEPMDLRELISKLLGSWHWFVVFATIGLVVGYVYHRMSDSEYSVNTTLIVSKDNKEMGPEFLFKNMGYNSNVNLEEQIGILSSYMLNLEAIKKLDWKIAWFRENLFKSADIYKNSPYEVILLENKTNLPGIPIYITKIDESSYKAEVNDNYTTRNTNNRIEFEITGRFNEPLESDYFNFIIKPRDNFSIDDNFKYYFINFDITFLTNFFRQNIAVSPVTEKSNLINVKIQGTNPQRLVDYLNMLTQVFIQFGLNEKTRTSENTVKFIDSQISGIVDSLQQAGQDYTSFRTQNNVVDLSQEAGFIMDRMKEIESAQAQATVRLNYYKNLLQYLGDAKQMEQMVAPSVVGITDISLNNMVVKLGELYTRRNTLALTVQERNPSIISIDNEIVYLQQSLQENLKNSISNTEVEIQNLEERKRSTNVQLSRLPKTEQNMVNIKRNFDLNNDLYTFLLQKRAEAAITNASTIPDTQVLDIARIENVETVGPGRMVKLLFGFAIGLIIPACFIFISEYLNNKITKKTEIDNATSIPTIGVIVHNKLKTDFPVVKFPNSSVTECFRSIRTNLQYLLDKDRPNVVAIQSMISSEGKSFVALNLALAFAINNRRVLVVDGDLRKPQLHLKFGDGNNIGLTNYLMNKATLDEVVKESKLKNLHYTTTGPVLRHTAELLDNSRFNEFLSESKKHFNIVIFNTPPISIVTDGLLIGNLSDANIIVIRQNFTHREHLRLINDFAEQGVIKNISLIFNDVKSSGSGYYTSSKNNEHGYFKEGNKTSKPKWKYKASKETLDQLS